jgi:glycosyltransferase involved in cell wall biosynthesis/Flp pilus assembly protein TadD
MQTLFTVPSTPFADEFLRQPRCDGVCLCLGADVPVQPDDTWDAVAARLPEGWRPDRLVVWLASPGIPDWVWSAPVPVVGLASDWDLLAHYYRHTLPLCDAILAEPAAVVALAAVGFTGALVADLSGLGRSALERPAEERQRDVDVLVIDPLAAAGRHERLPWVGRIAQLADGLRVIVRRPTSVAEDRSWLARARVYVQLPSSSGGDRMAYEAMAAGAALLRPPAAWDGPEWLRPGVDYAAYHAGNLEDVITHLLAHEDHRRALAAVARGRVREFAFDARLGRALSALDARRAELEKRAAARVASNPGPSLGYRVWAAACGGPPVELPEAGDPEDRPELAACRGVFAPDPAVAAEHFRHALTLDPTQPVAGANLAEALALAGRPEEAATAAQRALVSLDVSSARPFLAWDVPLYPLQDGLAQAEWDRTVWGSTDRNAEVEAKRTLLRWRLHAVLARSADDLSHYHEAALARPDLPTARAALGCALARRGRIAEALSHLKAGVAGDPFDRPAARALFSAMGEAGDALGKRLFARQQRRLAAAAPDACPAEPWFADAGPVGDELASVIVVVHDQADLTQLCLESVLRHTRRPFELILVDNGSNAETAALLEQYAGRPGPVRSAVVRAGENLGYPAAANRGLTAARGDFLVLLNNDAVVTPAWLEGLTEPLCGNWPAVGLVGPVSNAVPDPQRVPAGYRELEQLDAFALARRRSHAGRTRRLLRLSGFCLLTHRSVYDKVGPLDERFGRGFFDDDDWCVRVRQAGYVPVLAEDVYVHHFGSATFRALGEDTEAMLRANLELFRQKWGDAEAAPYRLPGAGSPSRRPTVSVSMIVKNEEHNLPDCLNSVRDLVDEMIVVDTGSSDRTKEVAAELGARVFEFPWVDSFAAARNESLRHATGDWVLWMDADDRVDGANRDALRRLFASLTFEPAAYVLKCRCPGAEPGASPTLVDHVRLFRNDPRLSWKYRVHEQILPALRAAGIPVRWAPVTVTHLGYADAAHRERKLQRDLRLLRIEEQEQPDEPFVLFNLGSVMVEVGRPEEALGYLRRSLAQSSPKDSIVRKLYALIAQCHRTLGRQAEALQACVAGRAHYPDDAELLFVEGVLRQEQGDWSGAVASWQRLVTGSDGDHFASVDGALRGAKARHNLAVAYTKLNCPEQALAQWRKAVAEDPSFVPAWVGLGRLGLAGDRALVGEAADHLQELGEVGRREADALRTALAAGKPEPVAAEGASG